MASTESTPNTGGRCGARAKTTGQKCRNPVSKGSGFCDAHRCRFKLSREDRCANAVLDGCKSCDAHCCTTIREGDGSRCRDPIERGATRCFFCLEATKEEGDDRKPAGPNTPGGSGGGGAAAAGSLADQLQGLGLGTAGSGLQQYSAADIDQALQHYQNRLLGEGGFGKVYRGRLRGDDVAIKVVGVEGTLLDPLVQELKAHSTIRNPHVVTLLGYCLEARALVFEHMAGGSLDRRLFAPGAGGGSGSGGGWGGGGLPWILRLRIALQTAQAVQHLHSMTPNAVLHRDLKPANILLDAHSNAKVADVGLASVVPSVAAAAAAAAAITISLKTFNGFSGTEGYIDPDFFHSGSLGRRSDVYAFGVVLCQLLTGERQTLIQPYPHQPNRNTRPFLYFAELLKQWREEGDEEEEADAAGSGGGGGGGGGGSGQAKFRALIDKRSVATITGGAAARQEPWPLPIARRFAELAVRCCEIKRTDRPHMDQVVAELDELLDAGRLVCAPTPAGRGTPAAGAAATQATPATPAAAPAAAGGGGGGAAAAAAAAAAPGAAVAAEVAGKGSMAEPRSSKKPPPPSPPPAAAAPAAAGRSPPPPAAAAPAARALVTPFANVAAAIEAAAFGDAPAAAGAGSGAKGAETTP